MYAAHNTEKKGILVGIPFVSYSCGIMLVYGMGSILNWRTVAWCAIMMPIFSFIAIALAPESPNWLARKGYYDKAKKGKENGFFLGRGVMGGKFNLFCFSHFNYGI